MFSKKNELSMDKIDTLIGKGSSISGTLTAAGTLRVDGKVEGNIDCQSDIIIGETGVVIADVRANNMLVAGFIKGDVYTAGKLEIASSGNVEGDITTKALIIDDGANFHGQCNMPKDIEETK